MKPPYLQAAEILLPSPIPTLDPLAYKVTGLKCEYWQKLHRKL